MKVAIVGAGNVGSACLLSLVTRNVAREIVVINRRHERAEGVVADIQYAAPLSSPVAIRAGHYADLAGARVVLITAGINEQSGGATDRSDPEGRLKLLDRNAAVYRDVVPQIVANAPQALILVVTDPPDPLADLARKLAGHDRVLSAGTFLDTLRFRFHLARRLGVDPLSVEAQVLGEHGTSLVFLWSSARIGGQPIREALDGGARRAQGFRQGIEQEVRFANITIIEGTGASQLGIGMAAARITEMILRDERAVIPIGAYHERYGTTLSLPAVLGAQGISRVLEADMTQKERSALDESAGQLRRAVARLRAESVEENAGPGA
jgi:L-lactate dehydrogenase